MRPCLSVLNFDSLLACQGFSFVQESLRKVHFLPLIVSINFFCVQERINSWKYWMKLRDNKSRGNILWQFPAAPLLPQRDWNFPKVAQLPVPSASSACADALTDPKSLSSAAPDGNAAVPCSCRTGFCSCDCLCTLTLSLKVLNVPVDGQVYNNSKEIVWKFCTARKSWSSLDTLVDHLWSGYMAHYSFLQ